jgi:hypothetical protein
MLDQAMSFAEFALICTYLVISVLSQIKFFLILIFLMSQIGRICLEATIHFLKHAF